jgi:lipopolysaccharide export system permease protein
MYILTRYVLWEVTKLFLIALLGLTMIVTPVMGVQEGLKQGLPALVILRILPYMLPEMFGITIPVSMLFAVCSVFGRMTGANEMVAMKSLGISPMAAIWPAIVLAAFLSLGTVYTYEFAATHGRPGARRIIAESVEDIAYGMLQKNRSCKLDKFAITVKNVVNPTKTGDRPKLIEPTITITGPPRILLSAAEATLHTDLAAHQLTITCRDTTVDIAGKGSFWNPGEWPCQVPIDVPQPDRYHRDWVALRDIPDRIIELQNRNLGREAVLRQLERLSEASKALGEEESSADAKKLTAKQGEISDDRRRIARLRAEPYRRWANGFTCLCFTLLGTPVAMLWRHADVLTNFFVCFLPILALYYPLLMLSDDLATSTSGFPPVCFWTGNVILLIPALGLMNWVVKH